MNRTHALAAAALILAAGSLVAGPPAAAAAGDMECIGSEGVTYSPALTTTTQSTTVSRTRVFAPCTSISQPAITSGTFSGSVQRDTSCLTLLNPVVGSVFTITWNTGQTTTITGNGSSSMVGATVVLTVTGAVTGGLFAGDSATYVFTAPATSILLCTLGLGTVPSLSGPTVLTIA